MEWCWPLAGGEIYSIPKAENTSPRWMTGGDWSGEWSDGLKDFYNISHIAQFPISEIPWKSQSERCGYSKRDKIQKYFIRDKIPLPVQVQQELIITPSRSRTLPITVVIYSYQNLDNRSIYVLALGLLLFGRDHVLNKKFNDLVLLFSENNLSRIYKSQKVLMACGQCVDQQVDI